jgi:hypothetical protein
MGEGARRTRIPAALRALRGRGSRSNCSSERMAVSRGFIRETKKGKTILLLPLLASCAPERKPFPAVPCRRLYPWRRSTLATSRRRPSFRTCATGSRRRDWGLREHRRPRWSIGPQPAGSRRPRPWEEVGRRASPASGKRPVWARHVRSQDALAARDARPWPSMEKDLFRAVWSGEASRGAAGRRERDCRKELEASTTRLPLCSGVLADRRRP